MILYHRTDSESAKLISRHGFRDGQGKYLTEHPRSGVWVSDEPLDENEGAHGDILLEVSIEMTETEIAKYEWIEPGKQFREFLIPAAELNPRMTLRIAEDRNTWIPDWAH